LFADDLQFLYFLINILFFLQIIKYNNKKYFMFIAIRIYTELYNNLTHNLIFFNSHILNSSSV
ncbi:MAG TPA: hypothetical protein DEB71_01320, partial [Chryseobacterium carnipullorum]|nr:hypothetical protein [Chryseobacterium carnipullorum]